MASNRLRARWQTSPTAHSAPPTTRIVTHDKCPQIRLVLARTRRARMQRYRRRKRLPAPGSSAAFRHRHRRDLAALRLRRRWLPSQRRYQPLRRAEWRPQRVRQHHQRLPSLQLPRVFQHASSLRMPDQQRHRVLRTLLFAVLPERSSDRVRRRPPSRLGVCGHLDAERCRHARGIQCARRSLQQTGIASGPGKRARSAYPDVSLPTPSSLLLLADESGPRMPFFQLFFFRFFSALPVLHTAQSQCDRPVFLML
jgi:hypothetical protein